MKRYIISGAIGLSLLTGACAAEDTLTVPNAKTYTSTVSTPKPLEPIRTKDGRTWSDLLSDANVEVSEPYSKQVCSYIEPLLEDGYSSDSDMQSVAIKVFNDKDQTLNTEQIVAVVVSSVMRVCPNFINLIKNSN